MTESNQTLVALNTSSLQGADTVRQSFVFDLSQIDWHSTNIVAASLHLGPRQPVRSIAFTDPGQQADYGEGVIGDDGGTDIPLSAPALRDLHEARGGFFWIQSVCRDSNGDARFLRASNRNALALRLRTQSDVRAAA